MYIYILRYSFGCRVRRKKVATKMWRNMVIGLAVCAGAISSAYGMVVVISVVAKMKDGVPPPSPHKSRHDKQVLVAAINPAI